ncbi:MAG: hypothetical protein JST96_09380 [Bacteroidetes bacterium]|nr:hypothetical protein [Bacteroidota bacterium]
MQRFINMFLKNNDTSLKKSDWYIIIFFWLSTQLILFFTLGINDKEESLKYIGLADQWLSGVHQFSWNYFFYSGYVAILVILKSIGLPVKAMYVAQLLLSFYALNCFVKTISLWITNRLSIIVSAVLYASCFIFQQWVTYLFTDAFFANLLVIAIYYLIVSQTQGKGKIAFWFLLLILPFFRPIGFLFIILACVYWTMLTFKMNLGKIGIALTYLFVIGVLIYISLTESPGFFYPFHNVDANIICGYPADLLKYRVVPYHEGMNIFSYVFDNPGMFLRLCVYRFYKVFSMTRPFFSPMHNVLLVIAETVYYVLAVFGILRILFKKEKEKYFLLMGILLFSVPSVVFCVDWSGRFSLTVYCFIFPLSALGTDFIFSFLKNKKGFR